MTNKERLIANNEKIQAIQETLKNKILASLGDGEYFVKVIDYDGTILKEARLDAGDTFTLPSAPSHDGLVFQEWSCSQEIVDGVITIEDNNVMVGAVYTTASGLNEFDIEITKAMEADIATNGFVVTLNMNGTKDWGDGSSDDLTTHTYMNYGEYTIKCNGTTITTSSSAGIFGQLDGTPNEYCKNVRITNIEIIGAYAFGNCRSIESITISNHTTNMGEEAFTDCYALKCFVFPSTVTTIGDNLLYGSRALESVVVSKNITQIRQYFVGNCHALKNISIPNGVTRFYSSIFVNAYALENVIVPKSVTDLSGYAFKSCYSLKKIIIPLGVSRIENYTFQYWNQPAIYDFSTHTTIPTLSSSNAFSGINKLSKIVVSDDLYEQWIKKTNWITYAKYIYKASEVQ